MPCFIGSEPLSALCQSSDYACFRSRHLGRGSIEDLGSTYVLECLKAKRDRPHDAKLAPLTILNTVRRRLVRQAQQAVTSKELECLDDFRGRDQLARAAFAETLPRLFSQLDVREKILLDGMLRGQTLKESASEAGISPDAARQAAGRLRKTVRPWLARLYDLPRGDGSPS